MFAKLKSLWRVTAIRLSIIYTLIFGLVAVGLIVFMTGATVNILQDQYRASIDAEITGLNRIYQRGGSRQLFRTLERRSRAPGANLYVVTNPDGEILGGNVPWLERDVMQNVGWTERSFRYQRFEDDKKNHRAVARVLEVPNGVKILVGRDIREAERLRGAVAKGFQLALGAMLALGILTWIFVGRRALKRIDGVSQSTIRIMGGDRSERLPVTGSKDEFDRLSENLNQMLDRINTLDAGTKQMSDNIAHDLKTPITRLRNKAEEALSLREESDEQQNAITEIIDDCDRIVKTFDALLMISRVESGSTVATFSQLDVQELVGDVYELYEALAEDEGVKLHFEQLENATMHIDGNRELISQAISNLIDNAIKYGGDEINLLVEKEAEIIKISVMDNGKGIEEEDRSRVMERFVRLEQSRNTPGNGLGLSLVNAIAKLHRGNLLLEAGDTGLKTVLEMPNAK